MMAMGGMEILLILGMLAGGGTVDVVSSLPANDYFMARDIEVSADKLMELATETPDSGKKQFAQLMALAHLASEPDLITKADKSAEHRKTLADIAAGRKAADPQGFAADYAKKVLRAISGEKPPAPTRRSWKEGIKHLPDNASMVGFIEVGSGGSSAQRLSFLSIGLGMMPKEAKDEMWKEVEKVGNIEVASLGFTLKFDGNSDRVSEFVIRVTGRGNPEFLLPLMTEVKEVKDKERADVDGQKIRVFSGGPGMPAIALIGTRELIFAGSQPDFGPQGKKVTKKGEEILEQVLATRGKSGGPVQGNLKGDLAKVPADAVALFVGNLPPDKNPSEFPVPRKVIAYGKPFAGSVDLLVTAIMADETAAKDFIEKTGQFRDMGLQQLKMLQGQPLPVPGLNIAGVITLLESIELNAENNEAKLRALVPEDMMSMMMAGFMIPFQMRALAPPPQPQAVPAPAPQKKVEVKKK